MGLIGPIARLSRSATVTPVLKYCSSFHSVFARLMSANIAFLWSAKFLTTFFFRAAVSLNIQAQVSIAVISSCMFLHSPSADGSCNTTIPSSNKAYKSLFLPPSSILLNAKLISGNRTSAPVQQASISSRWSSVVMPQISPDRKYGTEINGMASMLGTSFAIINYQLYLYLIPNQFWKILVEVYLCVVDLGI